MPSDKVKDRLRKARAASKRKVVDYGQHPLIRDQERLGMPRAELSGYRPRVADWAKDTFGSENARRVLQDRVKNPGKILSAPVVAAMGAVEGVKNAYDGVKYFMDPKTAPHPGDRRADATSARKAFDVASMAGGGNLGARAVSRFNYLPDKYYHGSNYKFGPGEKFDTSKSIERGAMFVTPRRREAEYFGENVMPLRIRSKKFFDHRKKSHLKQIKDPDMRQEIADGHFVGFSKDEFQDFLREKGYSGWYEHEGRNVATTIYPKEYVKAYKLGNDEFFKKIEELDEKALREVRRRPNLAIMEPNTVYRRNGRRFYSSGTSVPIPAQTEEKHSRLKAARKKAKQGS